jgi:hypothetical protein
MFTNNIKCRPSKTLSLLQLMKSNTMSRSCFWRAFCPSPSSCPPNPGSLLMSARSLYNSFCLSLFLSSLFACRFSLSSISFCLTNASAGSGDRALLLDALPNHSPTSADSVLGPDSICAERIQAGGLAGWVTKSQGGFFRGSLSSRPLSHGPRHAREKGLLLVLRDAHLGLAVGGGRRGRGRHCLCHAQELGRLNGVVVSA